MKISQNLSQTPHCNRVGRSKKNNTVLYLDNMDDKLKEENLINKIVPAASKGRDKIRLRRNEIHSQIADRDTRKKQKLVVKDRKNLEKIKKDSKY